MNAVKRKINKHGMNMDFLNETQNIRKILLLSLVVTPKSKQDRGIQSTPNKKNTLVRSPNGLVIVVRKVKCYYYNRKKILLISSHESVFFFQIIKYQEIYFGPMSLRAQICSSPMADITLTTRSFPSPKPSLICTQTNKTYRLVILVCHEKTQLLDDWSFVPFLSKPIYHVYKVFLIKTIYDTVSNNDYMFDDFKLVWHVLLLDESICLNHLTLTDKPQPLTSLSCKCTNDTTKLVTKTPMFMFTYHKYSFHLYNLFYYDIKCQMNYLQFQKCIFDLPNKSMTLSK